MDPQYSTLEHIRHDETAGALHCGYDTIAVEIDTDASAPQAVPDESPQVFFATSLPEAQGNEESNKERAPSLPLVKHSPKWLWVVVALVVTAAIAVGVAVGIWRHREHSHYSLVSQNHSIPSSGQFILNDTSLAATYDANGNRYLFFQDSTGHIRGAVRTDNQWSTSLNLGNNSSAKNYTPLAVTGPDSASDFNMTVYYVSEGHVLNSSTYSAGSWSPDLQSGDLSSENFSTAVTTRSLSVAKTGTFLNSSFGIADLALLYYESPTGKVSALCQESYYTDQDLDDSGITQEWIDITSQESKSLPDVFRNAATSAADAPTSIIDVTSKTLDESFISSIFALSAPFVAQSANATQRGIEAYFYSPNASEFAFQYNLYMTGPSGPGNFSAMGQLMTESSADQDYSSIYQSDIALLGQEGFFLWINYTEVVIVKKIDQVDQHKPPDNIFPFARLASLTLADGSYSYLYHQINGTTLAEEQWDSSLGAWTATENISISYF